MCTSMKYLGDLEFIYSKIYGNLQSYFYHVNSEIRNKIGAFFL